MTKKRKSTARKDAAKKLEQARETAQEEWFEALDRKGEALAEKEEALTAADESMRLDQAAAKAKEQRKGM